jgi:hypothetical protein
VRLKIQIHLRNLFQSELIGVASSLWLEKIGAQRRHYNPKPGNLARRAPVE